MYSSLGIPKDDDSKEFRKEAIHITGFSNKVTAEDLQAYFKDFNPIGAEWCDGKSANVLWAIDASAAKAMCYLSRPITDEMTENDAPNANLEGKFESTKFNEAINIKQFNLPEMPQSGQWRIGKPSNLDNWKDAKAIFMRLSRSDDSKPQVQDVDLNKRNFELRREGGILSNSKKQRIRQAMALDQQMHEEHERSKKYTPGKAGWQEIAEDWANTKKKANDFSDDLAILASQLRNQGKRVSMGRNTDWDAPQIQTDWDAPQDENSRKRKRRLIASEEIDSEDEENFGETIKLTEDDSEWTKRSKKPRMRMHSDDVETKVSAKHRILSSIKRRVKNPTQRERMEIYEEDVPVNDARSKLLNRRFESSKIDIRSRLGGKFEPEPDQDLRDSLERDTGADLGDPTEKMIIQVTQSDNEENMEQEDNRDIDHRKPKDLRSKISSEVSRPIKNIKQEKDVEDRKKRNEERERREFENRRAIEADRRKQAEFEDREARRRQRSQRRVDRDDQEERRRRREHERRYNDSRINRDRDFRDNRGDIRENRNDRDMRENRNDRDMRENRNDRDKNRRPERRDRKEVEKKRPIKIKKEKMSDDSSSSDSDSSSSSSDSDSSSSDSSSSSSSSSSDSSSSSSGSDRKKKRSSKKARDAKAKGGQEGIKDKLQEYLAKAKERRKNSK